jgi:ATP-dependent RNA helicase DDX3X
VCPTGWGRTQIQDESSKFSFRTGLRTVVAYGGADIREQMRELERGVDLMVSGDPARPRPRVIA